MIRRLFGTGWISFAEIYCTQDENAKGRRISLASVLLQAVMNVFITGIFYTGFLAMYGMSITDAGIITVIPYIANLCGIFSGKILSKFKSPKKAILAAKFFYYLLYIPGITVMPAIVSDQQMRLVWFVVLMFASHVLYAPFSPGMSAWLYSFYPKDNERRARFIMFQNIFSSVMSSTILLGSGYLTDMLSNSPYQNQLIIGFRYFAFGLAMADILVQSRARDFKAVSDSGQKLIKMITLPFRHKKFMFSVAIIGVWGFLGGMNGLWNYHILTHVGLSYSLINTMTVLYTMTWILFSGYWRKILNRFSWIRTFSMTIMLLLPTEFMMFFLSSSTVWLYVVSSVLQNFLTVGTMLAYGNILYMNMPDEDSTTYIAFSSIVSNFAAFLGLSLATAISGISGDETMRFLNMEIYSFQIVILVRGIAMFLLGVVLFWKWKLFTGEKDIAAIELQKKEQKKTG